MRRIYKPKNRGKESPYFSLHFQEGEIVIRQSLRTDCREEAEEEADDLIRQAREARRLEKAGIKTHANTRAVDLADLIVEYLEHLEGKGRTSKHCAAVQRRLGKICDAVGAQSIEDLTTERIDGALAELKARKETTKRIDGQLTVSAKEWPASAAEKKHVRQALSSFFNWLVKRGRWAANPCKAIEIPSAPPEVERRALTVAEQRALLKTAPRHRRLVYWVILVLGLRRAEAHNLRWSDVDLDDDPPTVRIKATEEKNRKGAILVLAGDVINELRKFREQGLDYHEGPKIYSEIKSWKTRIKDGFALPPTPNLKTFYRDLERAGIKVEASRYKVDLHSLRVTTGTNLARADVDLKHASQVMRHSSIELTAKVYQKLRITDSAKTVDKVRRLLGELYTEDEG